MVQLGLKEDWKWGKDVRMIRVEGHTDDILYETGQFQSNLQLSAAQATKVALVIIEEIGFPKEHIMVRAHGGIRPIK